MKNVRQEGADLVYDCESPNCGTPGEPHSIPLNAVMAALEATFREFIYHGDPRAEGVDVALQYLYQQLYSKGAPDSFATDPVPWEKEFRKLITVLDQYYDVDGAPEIEPRKKEYLN